MDDMTLSRMKDEFKTNFNARQDAQKSFKNVDDFEKFAEKSRDQMQENLRAQERFVEERIFDGELEQQARKEEFDFTHNYVYRDAEETVAALNQALAQKIGQFGEADISEHGSVKKEAPLGAGINKPPKAAGWKQRTSEKSKLSMYRKFNPRADISTVRELKVLDKYNELREDFLETDEKGGYKNELFREAEKSLRWMNKPDEYARKSKDGPENDAEEQSGESREKGKYLLKYGLMPFLKIYKKGWFGRKYTIDGKRIEEKPGQMTYDEYNAEFIRVMSLDTRFDRKDTNREDPVILENRKVKGAFIMNLAKELMDYRVSETMLTDEYLAEHVGEMQQYVDKLNAFRVIIQENRWVFNTGGEKLKAVDDEYLASLVETRIFQVSDRLNIFMDEHYAAHGMYRTGKFTFKKLGMMTGKAPVLYTLDQAAREKKRILGGTGGKKLSDTQAAMKELNDFETELKNNTEYRQEQVLNSVKPIVLAGPGDELEKEEVREEYVKKTGELNENLGQSIHKASEGLKNAYDEAAQFADKLLDEIIADSLKGFRDRIVEETGMGVLPIKKFIEGRSEMSLLFGPEIEQLYTKLYTSKRLSAELRARKDAINKELEKDSQREESIFSYKTKNVYGAVLNDYFSEDIKKHAMGAGRVIDEKLKVLDENNSIIEKTIRFFLEEPNKTSFTGDDLKQIHGYLKKEGLERMFHITRIDTYKEVMDEAILEKDLSMREKDSGEARFDDIKKVGEMTSKDRALQIYNVRRRDKARVNLGQWLGKAEEEYTKEEKETASALLFTPSYDATKVDHKGEIPVNDEKSVKKVYDQHQIELTAKKIKDSRSQYNSLSSLKIMTERYRIQYPLVKDSEIKPKAVIKYMAKVRARIDFLAAHSEVNEALLKIRQNPSYPYFDMSRISGLPRDELKDLIGKLKTKEEELAAKLDALGGDEADTLETWKLKDKLAGTKDMRSMTEEFLKIRQFETKYPRCSEEAIDNKAREYELELRTAYARENFRNADERYVQLEDIFEENRESLRSAAYWTGQLNRRIKEGEKNGEKVRDSELEETLKVRCAELLDIPVEDSVERLKRLSDENVRISPDDVVTLGKRWGVIRSLSGLFNRINDPDADSTVSEADKRLMKIINQSKHRPLRDAVLKKLPLLKSLGNAIENYLAAYNFKPSGSQSNDDWGVESRLTDEQIQDAVSRYKESSKEQLKEFEEQSREYEPDVVEGRIRKAKEQVFEELLKKGEKLSILELDKWKKKIEGIVKINGLLEGLIGERYWRTIAAMQILDDWPYAFEQFYALRIRNDTYRAFSVQIRALLGKEGAGLLNEEQIQKSVELSQYVSEQESRTYFVLNENDTKELNRALEANHYDKKAFMYLFKQVEVNASGMPLGSTEVDKRYENARMAKTARSYFALKPEEKKQSAEENGIIREFAADLQERIIKPLIKDRHLVDMNESMLTEKYIGEHFRELYELGQKIACLDTIYRNNREYFTDTGLLSGMEDYDRIKKLLDDNFGSGKNRIMYRFKQLIDAYAGRNFVDGSGSFDIGLSAEDLFFHEDKKTDKADMEKRNEKVREAVKKRDEEFERRRSDVDSELSRNIIAKHTAESARAFDIIYNVNISSTGDKLFSVEGHVSDFALLVQDKSFLKIVGDYEKAAKRYDDSVQRAGDLFGEISELNKKGEPVSPELNRKYETACKERDSTGAYRLELKGELEAYKNRADDFYSVYQKCHDKNGKLVLETKGKDGQTISRIDEYIWFQATVATDMSDIFNGFAEMYREHGNEILNEEFIADQMKKDNWGEIYTGYKRFNLYSAMLQKEAATGEKDKKGRPVVFSKNSPSIRYLDTKTKELEKSLKDAQKSSEATDREFMKCREKYVGLQIEFETAQADKKAGLEPKLNEAKGELQVLSEKSGLASERVRTLEKQVEDYRAASGNLGDLSSRDEKTVDAFRDYVAQVERVLIRYGVRDDGELMARELDQENMDMAAENAYKAYEAVAQGQAQKSEQ